MALFIIPCIWIFCRIYFYTVIIWSIKWRTVCRGYQCFPQRTTIYAPITEPFDSKPQYSVSQLSWCHCVHTFLHITPLPRRNPQCQYNEHLPPSVKCHNPAIIKRVANIWLQIKGIKLSNWQALPFPHIFLTHFLIAVINTCRTVDR